MINKVILHRLEVGAQKVLNSKSWSIPYPKFSFERVCSDLIIQLRGYLDTLPSQVETVVCDYPATWWQHFKHQYFPTWLCRKFPIKMHRFEKHVTIFKAVCPHGRWLTPDNCANFMIKEYDREYNPARS